MAQKDPTGAAKLERYRAALETFVERLREDRHVLAAVLLGTLSEETIWRKESLGLWVIEADGVARRLRSDGNDERIFRTLVEDGINFHVELIPRSRFKRMVEGSSRTAFSCNFFAARELVYCDEPSIEKWFDDATAVATRDRERELLASATGAIHAHRWAEKLLTVKGDLELAKQATIWAAHCLAEIQIVLRGEIYEQEVIYKAIEYNPDLFQTIYLDVIARRPQKKRLREAISRIDACLEQNGDSWLKPLIAYLKKQKRVVPFSEVSDHFAYTQLYPWHLESACEWLERKGCLEKVAAPFKLTSKSRVEVEEPAYFYDP